MASDAVPNVPYKSPMLDQGGFLTPAWSAWFRTLFARVGGSVAPSISDINLDIAGFTTSITNLNANIATLSASISALQGQINDLNQGRHL